MYDLLEEEHKDKRKKLVMGRWGEVALDSLPKEFVAVIKNLEPGQISDLITYEKLEKKQDGTLTREKKYYFFELEYKIPAKNFRFTEVKADIEKKLLEQSKKRQLDEWLRNEKSKTFIRYFHENIDRKKVIARINALYTERNKPYEPSDNGEHDESADS
jgi:hypothetical protein